MVLYMIYSPENRKWWRQGSKDQYWTQQEGATTWLKSTHAELALKYARQKDCDAYIQSYEVGQLIEEKK